MVSTPTKRLNPKFKMRTKPIKPMEVEHFSLYFDDCTYLVEIINGLKDLVGDDFSGVYLEIERDGYDSCNNYTNIRVAGKKTSSNRMAQYELDLAEYNKWAKEHASEIAKHKANLKEKSDAKKRKQIEEKEQLLRKQLDALAKAKENL